MRDVEREDALRELDEEMKHIRLAAKRRDSGWGSRSLLKRIRTGLGIPVADIVDALGVERAVLWRLEKSEERGTITLKALHRAAKAMGCKVIYGIVPEGGETMAEKGQRIRWLKRMVREHGEGE